MVSLPCDSEPTALEAVFSIPELYEEILSQLPMRDLLLAQLVCSRWAALIPTSPTLQAALFFTPVNPSCSHPRFNPLLFEMFPPFFRPETEEDDYSTEEYTNFSGEYGTGKGGMYTKLWYLDKTKREKVLSKDASWRKMYPMHPAPRMEKVKMTGGCGCGVPTFEERVVSEGFEGCWDGDAEEGGEKGKEEGARMGLVWDVLVWVFDDWPDVRFFLKWPNAKIVRAIAQGEGDMDRTEVDSEDGVLDVVDDRGAGLLTDGETLIRGVEGDGEIKSLIVLIEHSTSCFSDRRGGLYERVNPWPRSGLAIREFEGDLIRVVETSNRSVHQL